MTQKSYQITLQYTMQKLRSTLLQDQYYTEWKPEKKYVKHQLSHSHAKLEKWTP